MLNLQDDKVQEINIVLHMKDNSLYKMNNRIQYGIHMILAVTLF